MSNVKAIPEGFHSVTPYLIVDNAAEAIEFYKKALGATEKFRLPGPDGTVGHAEIQIGNCMLMLGDECPQMQARSAKTIGGSPIGLCVYLEDVDTAFAQAVKAGGKEVRPVQDQFYGDRSGTFEDPYGLQWTLATHIEDVSAEEIQRRMQAYFEQKQTA